MIWSLTVYVLATFMLFVAAAPKLRYVLFDPLTYEAKAALFSARRDSSVVNPNPENPTTKTPADLDTANLIFSDSSGEFLENDANVTEQIENKTISTPTVVTTTTQTTSSKIEAPAPALRSKSCFSCIGSLRTGETAPISLKSLPIYLRANENQKRYPKFGYEFDEAVCKLVGKRILCGYNKNTGDIPNSKEAVHIDAECRIRGDRIECGYGNTGSGARNGGNGKRALKLQLPTEETETTFKLKDILELKAEEIDSVATKNYSVPKETKLTSVKKDSVTIEIKSTMEPNVVIQHADLETYSTNTEPTSEEHTTSTISTPTTMVTTTMTDTTTEINITIKKDTTTANPEIDKEISSKIPFLSLRSIMKMSEDLEKMARQGSETETTEYVKAVTRCVEIGDRIVCYNYKPRLTTLAAAPSSTTTTTST